MWAADGPQALTAAANLVRRTATVITSTQHFSVIELGEGDDYLMARPTPKGWKQ